MDKHSTKLSEVQDHHHTYCPERTVMEDEPPPLRSEVLEALHGGGGTQLFFR